MRGKGSSDGESMAGLYCHKQQGVRQGGLLWVGMSGSSTVCGTGPGTLEQPICHRESGQGGCCGMGIGSSGAWRGAGGTAGKL